MKILTPERKWILQHFGAQKLQFQKLMKKNQRF